MFDIEIGKIIIAHEYVLRVGDRCDYSSGRKAFGIVFVKSGEAEFCFSGGGRVRVSKGEAVLLSKNAAYTVAVKEDYEHYTVNFEIREGGDALLSGDNCIRYKLRNPKAFDLTFKKLADTWKNKKVGYNMLAKASVYELFALLELEEHHKSLNSASYSRLMAAKEYIDENYAEKTSTSHLASLCFMSETNFRRTFLRVFGEPPMTYRNKVIIMHAKEYLISGYYSVSRTAEKCGFSDVSYFVRFFRKQTGMTPGEFIGK